MSVLKIIDLHVEIEGKEILKGINLEIKQGEVHAIMGPNGTGKSTLAQSLMGHPSYTITKGNAFLDDIDILQLPVDQRAILGLFLAMQAPIEVPGVTNSDFMRQALNARREKPINLFDFILEYEKNAEDLKMRKDLPHRYLNQGFSGGERKRNEILQLKTLRPKFAILDEIDSGLDVDALKIVGENVNKQVKETNLGCLLITHYQRLLDYIVPDFVHVVIDGKIKKTGNKDLILKIDKYGYDWLDKDEE